MKKRSKAESTGKLVITLEKGLFILFLYWIGIVLTFYYRNAYFDILDAKAELFFSGTKLFMPLGIAAIIGRLARREIKISVFQLFLLSFLLSSAISTFSSYDPYSAFVGNQGWYVGYYSIASLIVVYLAFGNKPISIRKEFYYPLLLASLLQYLLIISDAMGFDLLSMRTQLEESSHFAYLGTLGNSNWIVGYLSLMLPLQICFYLSAKSRYKTCFDFVLSLSGLLASILIGADGMYVSMGIYFLLLAPFIMENIERIKRFLILIGTFLIMLILISVLEVFEPFFVYYDSIGKLLFDHKILFLLFFVLVLLFFFVLKLDPESYDKKKDKYIKLVMISYVLAVAAIVSFAIAYRGDKLDNYRFELWNLSLKQFARFDTFHKLFGLGPEMLRNVYSPLFEKYGVVYTVSHSEPIQILLTMGVFGLLFWSLCWICLLGSLFHKEGRGYSKKCAVFASAFAYLGQAFVNSATLLNLCFLTLFVIHLSVDCEEYQKVDENV